MKNILIIEDDPAMRKALVATLESENFETRTAVNGIDGYEMAIDGANDLIILDLMLPGKTGTEICRDLRMNQIDVPILILSSKQDEIDKVLLLELGADDYLTKPPGLRELIARVKVLLRRTHRSADLKQPSDTVQFAGVLIDFKRQEATKNGKTLKLSAREFEILHFFSDMEGEVVSRDQLLNAVWGYETYPTTRTIDNFIANLRKKIENNPADPRHLITVFGSGYKFIR